MDRRVLTPTKQHQQPAGTHNTHSSHMLKSSTAAHSSSSQQSPSKENRTSRSAAAHSGLVGSQSGPAVARYAHPHSPNPSMLTPTLSNSPTKGTFSLPPSPSASNYTEHALASPVLNASNAHAHSQLHSPPGAFPFPPTAHSVTTSAQAQQQQQQQQPARMQAGMTSYQRPVQQEPTMSQLLERQGGALQHYQRPGQAGDVTMANATGVASWRKGQGFKEWEKVRLNSAEVKRKADVAQLFFYDHYFNLLTSISARKTRLAAFRESALERQLSAEDEAREWKSYCGRERVILRKRRTKLHLGQFVILCQVGQGGYGEVFLARHRDSHEVVALKKMRKRTLAKMDEIRHVLVERDILAATNSPWLVRLLYSFQDPTYVYLAMDFIAGGDFRTLLNNSGVLKEEHARFYIAEMFSAVNALHKLGYIHRDLKPENFLIDPTGHIKLTDFGLAAGALNPGKIESMKHKLDEVKNDELIFRSTIEMKSIYKSIRMADARYADSVVGSPDYMAIETLQGKTYSYSVDYWSLGCMLFEFLAGYPPFAGATGDETWNNLKHWQRSLRRPHYDRPEDRIFNLSDNGWAAITSLIAHKDHRLATLDAVKLHPFFRGVEWDTLRDSPAPFVPSLDSEVDAGYFDDFTSEADMAKYAEVKAKQQSVDRVKEKDDKFGRGVWVGFTFKAKKDNDKLAQDLQDLLAEEQSDELLTLF